MSIQLYRGSAAAWTSTNPVLLAGEVGRELDTGKWKVGDGVTAWVSLAYEPYAAQITLESDKTRKWFPAPTGSDDAGELTSRLNAGERDIAMRALTYNFTQAVAPTAGTAPVAIHGEGIERTRIRKTVDGDAFRIDTSGTVTIEGMTIKADVPSGGIMTSGAAIKVGPTPTSQTPYATPSLIVRDVVFDTVSAGSQFKYGVHCINGYETRFSNIAGVANIGFLLTTSAAGSGARGPHKWVDCTINSALYAVQLLNTTSPGIESVQLTNFDAVGCFYGVHAVNTFAGYAPPQIQVIGGHFNCSVDNFHVEKWAQVLVADALLYNNGTGAFFAFTDVTTFHVHDNDCFAVAGGDPDWMTLAYGAAGCGPGVIHDNYVALGATPKKPFRVATASAWLFTQVHNNKFTDASGNTITDLVTMTAGTLSPTVTFHDNPDTYWVTPTLLNSWVNTSGFQAARAGRNGPIVSMEGNIGGGTATYGTVLFTLPAGMRPATTRRFVCEANTTYGAVQVSATTGDVLIVAGGNAALSLDGISFSVA